MVATLQANPSPNANKVRINLKKLKMALLMIMLIQSYHHLKAIHENLPLFDDVLNSIP